MDESGIEATQALDFGDYDDDVTDDEQSENTPVGYLYVACQRGFPGKQYPVFEGDNVIGRGEECKISIPLKPLSREHACIEVKGDSHFIYDKGSRNRTRRNNHFLAASVRYELKHNDQLIFGDVECEYKIGVQTVDDDDGDETGSESMFQTAPGDEVLDNSTETAEKTEGKPLVDDDYASDASSDILEPTQPFAGNTTRTHNGNSTLAQNITVKDTPAAPKTKRFTEDLVVPESDSDSESPTKPPPSMALVADSQDDDDDDEDETVKSRMMGAATQAYVCESDVTTDDEDNVRNKSSILAASTQAYLDNDLYDVSTCSEDSPRKKSILIAATQAFVAESDDDKTPKKSKKLEPTVAYDMDEGIEPTQGYDMDTDNDDDDRKEENVEEQKSSGILFQPTQAYVGKEIEDEKEDVEDAKSDTSEEFVLEGDTDAENSDADEILAAPTLAVDDPGECETQVVSTEEPTQVVSERGEEDGTVAVTEEATQVFEEPKIISPRGKKGKKADKTLPIFQAETQVFQDNDETNSKLVSKDDATQAFEECKGAGKEQRRSAEPCVAETQVLEEDSTQVFDKDPYDKSKSKHKKVDEQTAETQVFIDDATQCFDDKTDTDSIGVNTAETVIEDNKGNAAKKADTEKHDEMATQVFEQEEGDAAVEGGDDEGETFDVTAASTLAFSGVVDNDSETEGEENDEAVTGGDEATQVFDEAESTVAVNDDQTLPVKSEATSIKPTRRRGRQKNVDETVAVTDDATQVIEEKTVETKATRGRRNKVADDTIAVSDDATQVFDETVAVSNENQTVSPEEIDSKTKSGRSRMGKIAEKSSKHVGEDATQVFDETVAVCGEDQTVCVEGLKVEGKIKSGGRKKGKKSEIVVEQEVNEDSTQVFDETVAVSETVPVEEIERTTKRGSRKKGKIPEQATAKQEVSEDATQVFDDTVAITSDDQTVSVEKHETKCVSTKKGKGKKEDIAKQEPTEEATQIFDATVAVEDITEVNAVTKQGRKSHVKKTHKDQIDDTVPISEDLDVNSEADSVESKTEREENTVKSGSKGKRTRGKNKVHTEVTDNVLKSVTDKKSKVKIIETKAEEVLSNVRKSGRTRGNVTMSDKEEVKDHNDGKQSKGKRKNVCLEESKNDEQDSAGNKKEKKDVEHELEAATQVYADDEGDEAATQRYEDDDQTPDMAEIEKDDKLNVPVVDTEPSRGRSPLKSALASPKKQKSPSPKKVQFVSQNSETSSESGEPSRRSKRRNKGVQKEVETTVAESETKNLAKVSVAAPLAGNKRSTRGKQATSKKDVKDEKEKSETVGDSNETEKSEICTDTGSHHTNDLSTEKVSGLTTKSTRSRGRKSVDTGINVKQGKVSRKTRTSLPAVLEESKPETIQQVDNSKDEKVVTDGKQNVTESKEKVKKNIKGKGKQFQVVKSENLSIKSEETAADTLQNSEPSEKRTNRSTRTNVSVSKTRNVEETQSDTTNNESGKSEDNTTTRSHRNGRRRVVDDADKMDNQVKKRKVDQVIAEGDKREESPETSSRTRTSRNKVSDKVSSDTKLVETESVNSKSKGKNRKSHTANAVISENNDSNSDGVKSDSVTDEMAITDDQQKVKGKGVRSKRGKDDKDDSETVKNNMKKEHIEDVVVDNKSKGSTRSKRGKVDKEPVKEEKGETAVEEVGRSRRLKRKESASSSNDSQESERGETPAKRQKKKNDAKTSTPKLAEKRRTTMNTPKGASLKELETSVTHSPTLRKTTTEEIKAKVMFTGVVDEQGEKIVKELGGDLVSSVTDCTHLVTDQVRRTVKFLCCLSRGIPIVSPQWLVSSKASGFFLDPLNFLVKDEASERKYKFSLEHSIEKAAKEPVFTSFTFKITKSVKPEPQHMKDILKCAGALKFIDKMPNSPAPQTVVISCPEDQDECEPAYKVGIPVVTAEFVLTGILRQKADINLFMLEKKGNGNNKQASSQKTSKKRKR